MITKTLIDLTQLVLIAAERVSFWVCGSDTIIEAVSSEQVVVMFGFLKLTINP